MNQFKRIGDLIAYANNNSDDYDIIEFTIDSDGEGYLSLTQYYCGGSDERSQGPFDSFDDLESFLLEQHTPYDVQVHNI